MIRAHVVGTSRNGLERKEAVLKELLSAQETAVMLGCSVAAVRKWAYQRRLRRVRIGRLARFRRVEIEQIAADGLPPVALRLAKSA